MGVLGYGDGCSNRVDNEEVEAVFGTRTNIETWTEGKSRFYILLYRQQRNQGLARCGYAHRLSRCLRTCRANGQVLRDISRLVVRHQDMCEDLLGQLTVCAEQVSRNIASLFLDTWTAAVTSAWSSHLCRKGLLTPATCHNWSVPNIFESRCRWLCTPLWRAVDQIRVHCSGSTDFPIV